jgi:hypothetical protein
MKNSLLPILLLFTITLYSQNYVNQTARWKQYQSWFGFSASSNNTTEVYFNGDTMINGLQYLKLWNEVISNYTSITYDSLGNQVPVTTTNTSTGFGGYFREENKKFYLIANGNPEILLYDFDVNVGTTLESIATNNYCGINYPSLINVDTVCIGPIVRKRWGISSSSYPAASTYIEGVGPNSGFRASICRNGCPECGYGLNLFTMNGDTLYYGSCSILPNEINQIENKTNVKVIVLENEIQIIGSKLNEIFLYNSVGQLVTIFTNINSSLFSIRTTALQNGIYFVKIKDGNEIIKRSIFVH